jgi:DNA (cytosine-5)-methyltransferase 1
MTAIDIFSGVGGMSIGAIMAGIDVKLAIDSDEMVAKTYAFNHPNTKVIQSDIKSILDSDFVHSTPIDVLFGGPPCQGFSRSNLKTRNLENTNNWLFKEFIRLATLWRPRWIVIENVRGLLETSKGHFLKEILKSLKNIDYKVEYKILNAVDFGVPQNRERLFIIGHPNHIKFHFPPTIHKTITVRDALLDLPQLPNGNKIDIMEYRELPSSEYAEFLRNGMVKSSNHGVSRNEKKVIERYGHIPQGGNWKNIPLELMENYKDISRCHTGIYHRINPDKPSVVIGNYRKNMIVHPVQHRGLSVREAARLQSFPDSFVFKGTLVSQQQQVGNAVPPLLSKAIFESILNVA